MKPRTKPGTAWRVPTPPKRKAAGPEGLGAYVVELILVGDLAGAKRVWETPIRGGKYAGMTVGAMLIRVVLEGMPTPGARRGSANWSLNACVAWAMMILSGLLPWNSVPFVLLEEYSRWCLGEEIEGVKSLGLWSSEVLSDIYGWTLHMLGALLAKLEGQRASAWAADRWSVLTAVAFFLSRLLNTHLWLLSRLTTWGGGLGHVVVDLPKIDVRHDPVVWTAGERSIPGRHTGAWLTSWLRWVTELVDNNRGKGADRAFANWPYRFTRTKAPRLTPTNHGARLRSTLEVSRHGSDMSTRLLGNTNNLTEPTMATSRIGGKLYVANPSMRDRKSSPMETKRTQDSILVFRAGVELASIPAPLFSHSETWHIGPGGWAEGPAS